MYKYYEIHKLKKRSGLLNVATVFRDIQIWDKHTKHALYLTLKVFSVLKIKPETSLLLLIDKTANNVPDSKTNIQTQRWWKLQCHNI